jgi:hypothetical protein
LSKVLSGLLVGAIFLLTAMALTIPLTGCGGEGDDTRERPTIDTYDPEASTTMTAASFTKAEFVRRMNKLCRQAWVTVTDNFAEYSGTQDRKLSEKERLAEGIEVSLLAGVDFHIFDTFRFQGSPPGDERLIEEMIGPFQAAVELGQKNIEHLDTFDEVADLFDRYNRRARKYGLVDCVVDEAHLQKLET